MLIVLFVASCGSNINQREQSFTQKLNEMLAWPEGGTYSDEVMQSVFDLIKKTPQSLEYKFEGELPHIHIATSNDGNLRAYSLERSGFEGNPSSGFECKILLQYRSGKTVFCEEVEGFNGYITEIYHVDSNKFYLLEDFQGRLAQGTHEFYSFSVYKIENKKLHKVKGAFVNRNTIYDNLEFSWDDYGGRLEIDFEKEDSAFIYNSFQKKLFDFIRIEQQDEDHWTYKCWENGQKQGEPDLVIEKGIKEYWTCGGSLLFHDEWVTDDESTPLGDKYTFSNKGYRYEFYHGWSKGAQLETLYVYDSKERLVYSGDFEPL